VTILIGKMLFEGSLDRFSV